MDLTKAAQMVVWLAEKRAERSEDNWVGWTAAWKAAVLGRLTVAHLVVMRVARRENMTAGLTVVDWGAQTAENWVEWWEKWWVVSSESQKAAKTVDWMVSQWVVAWVKLTVECWDCDLAELKERQLVAHWAALRADWLGTQMVDLMVLC